MSARKPFTKRQRDRATQSGFGYRATNDWGSGDLPAPWAEGDVIHLAADAEVPEPDRLCGMGPGYFVVTYGPSIGEGDEWYFRVWDGSESHGSDRLHVAYAGRSDWGEHCCDFMASFTLVETADPEGLAKRERMLAEGWQYDPTPVCSSCGQRVYEQP